MNNLCSVAPLAEDGVFSADRLAFVPACLREDVETGLSSLYAKGKAPKLPDKRKKRGA